MFDWLVDQANLFYFILGVVALLSLAAGWSTRRAKFWTYAASAVGLMVLVWLLTKVVISDRQQIVLNLGALSEAVIQKKADAFVRLTSKNFRYGPASRDEFFKLVSNRAAAHEVNHVHMWGQQVTLKGDTAEVYFHFRVDSVTGRGIATASANAKFVRDEGQWKLSEIRVFTLGTTERHFVPGFD
jgi:hypothetical protein